MTRNLCGFITAFPNDTLHGFKWRELAVIVTPLFETSQNFFCSGEVLALFSGRNIYDIGKRLLDLIDLRMLGEVIEVLPKIRKQDLINKVYRTGGSFDVCQDIFDLLIQDLAL